ncbi:MAG: hypothetical protein JOZ87_21905 [Chloroflexi bacterium]|nr:hypothetical protein [Chloroflexota bacterium]
MTMGTDEVASSEAVRLFPDRAQAVLPDFALGDRNATWVAEICGRLDGIRLAVELAAARVTVLSPEQIVERLDDRFRLLVGGSRTAPSRQQTLRATLDWSFELLSPPERVLFRRLGVFAGSCTLEAAESVCGWDPLATGDVAVLLFGLIDRSVVLAERTEQLTRYRLLETVRQYAVEQLRSATEEPIARDRHQRWYLDLAERAEPKLSGPDEQLWVEQLEREHDNLRAALDSALSSGKPEAALRIGAAVWKFWVIRGHSAEGQRWL